MVLINPFRSAPDGRGPRRARSFQARKVSAQFKRTLLLEDLALNKSVVIVIRTKKSHSSADNNESCCNSHCHCRQTEDPNDNDCKTNLDVGPKDVINRRVSNSDPPVYIPYIYIQRIYTMYTVFTPYMYTHPHMLCIPYIPCIHIYHTCHVYRICHTYHIYHIYIYIHHKPYAMCT